MNEKVVITGMGVISSIGSGTKSFFQDIKAGKSGKREINSFDTAGLPCKFASIIPDEDLPPEYEGNKAQRLAYYSVDEAVNDAGISADDLHRAAVFLGSIYGDISAWENIQRNMTGGAIEISQNDYNFPLWRLTENIGEHIGCSRSEVVISTACSSADYALGLALNAIRLKRIEVAVVVGVELVSEFIFNGFSSLSSLSTHICRPFDKNRDGLMLGEGAGTMIVESYSHAKKRGAHIHSELAGFGSSYEAYDFVSPEPRAKWRKKVIEMALQDAQISMEDVDYIKAHGTGTPLNDFVESVALKGVFKDNVYKIPISTQKSSLGHTCGACGIIEGIISILAMKENLAPPIINYEEPEDTFRYNYVKKDPFPYQINTVAQMAAGFGGSNTCIIYRGM
jgi:3-oxoacyl-[acyl-carrier-protein] synthase II